MKSNNRQEQGIAIVLSSVVINILTKLTIIIFLIMIVFQCLLYMSNTKLFFNTTYNMEYGFSSKMRDEKEYSIVKIVGNIPYEQHIIVKKNGIPVRDTISTNGLYIWLTKGDVLEIDATKNSSIYEITIQSGDGGVLPSNWEGKKIVTNNLYRFKPFSLKD